MAPMESPTTRVLAVLELLQTHGRLSGSALAARIGVDVRTLRRYIAALEELGIPVLTERGRFGGYALAAGFKLPPMMFGNDEALALSLGLLAARALGLADAAPAIASAQAKLERVMPASLKRRVRAIDETVALDLTHPPASSGKSEALLRLSEAALSRQRLRMRYRSEQQADSERDFDVYGIAFRDGRWYAVGHCHLRQGVRSFRVDRITDLQALPQSFGRPDGFDALAHLTRSLATLPRAHVIDVQLLTDIDAARAALFDTIGVLEQHEGHTLLRVHTDNLDWFARELSRLPFDFRIIDPPALRDALRRHVERLSRLATAPVLTSDG
jgi:predicted DNA-binding transcriptional regulator YafY